MKARERDFAVLWVRAGWYGKEEHGGTLSRGTGPVFDRRPEWGPDTRGRWTNGQALRKGRRGMAADTKRRKQGERA